jgi:D-sedoheptulose 7-phosphate isomerase
MAVVNHYDLFQDALIEHLKVTSRLASMWQATGEAIRIIACAVQDGGKVLVCGNGGSAADAQHMAAELAGRFRVERPPVAALALTTDTSVLTAIGNDYGYDEVFARQVLGLGKRGDVLVAISTSGFSRNVLCAAIAACESGISVVSLTGSTGKMLEELSDVTLLVPSEDTARVQEAHELLIHIICEAVELHLCG